MIKQLEAGYPTIKAWIQNYFNSTDDITPEVAPAETLFSIWENNKSTLYKLLGNKLTLTKEIKIDNFEELKVKIFDILFKTPFYAFFRSTVLQANRKDVQTYWRARRIVSSDALLHNRYDDESCVINDISVNKGEKVLKILRKFAEKYNKLDEFEGFRLRHSQILNGKKDTTKITLSIHPMDFLTSSDNNHNWSSCLSWLKQGCYRNGTVEMMNSPYIITAYIASEEPWCPFPSFAPSLYWNSKKWRQFFVVHPDVIAPIISYPYDNQVLTEEILDWIRELAISNLNLTFNSSTTAVENGYHNGQSIYFHTNRMFNDIDENGNSYICYLSPDCPDALQINYSGPLQCMLCGESMLAASSTRFSHNRCRVPAKAPTEVNIK